LGGPSQTSVVRDAHALNENIDIDKRGQIREDVKVAVDAVIREPVSAP
jgi:hypothetical protein